MLLITTCILLSTVILNKTNGFSIGNESRIFVGAPVHTTRRLVKECMTPIQQIQTLSPLSTVDEAMHLLLDQGVSGAPVMNEKTGQLLGVISSTDFLQMEAGDGVLFNMSGSKEAVESYLSAAKKICAQKVGDLMTTDVLTVTSTTTMKSAAALMSVEKMHRLMVVDDGRLVGLLTSVDVMKDMVRVVKGLPPSRDFNLVNDVSP
jgi:CBS domain-containing protein